jgi:hypothetical protein
MKIQYAIEFLFKKILINKLNYIKYVFDLDQLEKTIFHLSINNEFNKI